MALPESVHLFIRELVNFVGSLRLPTRDESRPNFFGQLAPIEHHPRLEVCFKRRRCFGGVVTHAGMLPGIAKRVICHQALPREAIGRTSLYQLLRLPFDVSGCRRV